MSNSDYSIEFAHIYADEVFGDEQAKSIDIAKEVIESLKEQRRSFVTSILIDDYNPSELTLDEEEFLKWVRSFGIDIDFVGHEAGFAPISDALLTEIPKSKLKLEYFHGHQKNVLLLHGKHNIGLKEYRGKLTKHTCSILSAAWTLCRLGIYKSPSGSITSLSGKPFSANKIITILPEKYKEGENKVLDIIKSTKYKACAKK